MVWLAEWVVTQQQQVETTERCRQREEAGASNKLSDSSQCYKGSSKERELYEGVLLVKKEKD